ncbi:unnamed protein product [Penicillium salamii]|nr:unnamed protein product [Penicillium salamii]
MLDGPNPNEDISDVSGIDEAGQYLDSDTVSMHPLTFWKEHQSRFPAIAALARDTLSFPATGAGVERLFNTARDICHYRRGRIKSETVEDLMMFLCTSRFDMEEQEEDLLKQFFSHSEIEATREEKDGKLDSVEFLAISDTEEQDQDKGDDEDLIELDLDAVEQDQQPEPSLPETRTQIRASGRKRKSREDDLFEYH